MGTGICGGYNIITCNDNFPRIILDICEIFGDCRMDMVINPGKSRKNVMAFVLLPPDCRQAVDLLIGTRSAVGVPCTNVYVFGRLTADTPMAGNSEMAELVAECPGLQFPDRIKSRLLRTYIGTVSQVCNPSVLCEH
jgi:hypothetical protein